MAYAGVIMKFVEYKRHLVNGVVQDPEFVTQGGVFHNPADHTWVGRVLDAADRTYYVPDTVLVLTRDELVARQLQIHADFPMTKKANPSDPHSESVALTDAEVTALVDTWVQE